MSLATRRYILFANFLPDLIFIICRLPNNEYDVNLSPEKRQVMLTHEAQVCQAIQERVVELWNQQTQGQFTPGAAASQPTYSQSTLQTTQLKSEGAAATTSSRKRPREEKTATAVTEDLDYGYGEPDERDSEKDGHNDNKDDEEQMGCGYEEHAPKRSYYHRQRREQEEQMTLNAAGGDIDCQYGEEHPSHRQHCENQQLQEQQRQAALLEDEMTSPERRRVQRRGGFVHDISTAKQFERPPPTPIDEHFTMPPIDDEEKEEADDEEVVNQDDMDTEDEVEEAPANKKRAAEDSPVPTERNETTAQMMMSSRRVTLTLNNNLEVTEEIPPPQVPVQDQEGHRKSNASDTSLDKTPNHSIPATSNDDEFAAARQNEVTKDATPSDDDRRLWIEARTRFNQRDSVDNSLEEEIDVLVKSSKRPDKASQEATETPQVTPILRQDADQQEGDMARTKSLNLSQFACQTSKIRSKEIHVTPGRHPADTGHKKESSMCQSNREMEEISNDKESSGSSPVKEPETVIWGTFQGTEQVVAMARMERHRMLERKRALKEVRPNSSLEEDDGNEVATGVDPNKKICLSKGDFSGMTVLGQFNLGFILAKDSSNHLWIFDQHACDERYNFEKLMAETIIHEQKLIAPMSLELDPSEESCILDHMAIFEKNGFRFKYEPDKPPRHRLALTALPHSGARDGRRAVQFGKEDVSALCAILGCRDTSYDDEDNGFYTNDGGTGTDGSGLYGNNAVRRHASSFSQGLGGKGGDTVDKVLTRLPKAIAMFASRACRSSVMIGTALSNKEMEKIIKRLNDLNDPWNCAHGRPTMTHITDLHPGLLKDERRAAEHIAGPT